VQDFTLRFWAAQNC